MFLYSTVSTLKPIVGIVVTISPSFSLYRIVVFPCNFKITNLISHCIVAAVFTLASQLRVSPAASRPTIRILMSFFPKSWLKIEEKVRPMAEIFTYMMGRFEWNIGHNKVPLLEWRKIFQVRVTNHSLSENSCCCLLIKKDWNYLIMLWSQGSEKIRVFSDRLYSKQNHQVKDDSGT